jgi:hypothetical protein
VRGAQWGLGAVGQVESKLRRVHRPHYRCPPWELLPQWMQGSPLPRDSGPGAKHFHSYVHAFIEQR